MAEAAKFLFDVDLEAPSAAEPPEVVRERELRTEFEAQLKAARAQAFEEGLREGEQQARNGLEAKAEACLQEVLASAQAILARLDSDIAVIRADALKTALAASQCLAGALMERYPTAHAEALFSECLEYLGQAPHVAIRVHDSLAEEFREKAAALAEQRGFAGKLIVLGDPETARGDCRIEWADGGISRNHEHLSLTLETIVRRHLGTDAARDGAPAPGPATAPSSGEARSGSGDNDDMGQTTLDSSGERE